LIERFDQADDMIFYDFEYERPGSLAEAAALLNGAGGDARLLAGGTDLIPNMRVEVVTPSMLVSLGGIEPSAPDENPDGSIRIDALSKLSDLVDSKLLRRQLPMLAESALTVASNQVREMGTLGGNLCQDTRCLQYNQKHDFQFVEPCYKRGGDCCYPFPGNDATTCWSVYMSDIACVLLALDGQLEILGPDGTRRMPVAELFTGDGLNPFTLGAEEIIEAVVVPPVPERFGWCYHKTSVRGGLDFGTTMIAIALQLAADGETCASARIVYGAVGQGPLRPVAAERAMAGAALDPAQIAAAASTEITPLPHHGFDKGFLRENIRVNTERSLVRAMARAQGRE
jgi:4-hydroxybenzoyl-CoA reductase beta subunit